MCVSLLFAKCEDVSKNYPHSLSSVGNTLHAHKYAQKKK